MQADHGALSAAAPADYETVFTNSKAGMELVDKEHVKKVVYEMSKDSAHFKNEQRKMEQVEERLAKMQEHARKISPAELAAHTRAMDAKMAELEAGRDLTRVWLHVDMDAFYAAVEELDNPRLVGQPFAVGGMGMISTASYAARKFGVRSAMPGFIGVRLCPQLTFVPPNFEKYMRASQATRSIFREYDAAFEAASLDEAYLDVTDVCSERGMTGGQVGEEIRRRVRETTQLTCSVGLAPNRMLAKVCSDLHKPDGQYVLESSRQRVCAFISTLPIRKVPGVGKVTEHMLKSFGVRTCGDLIAQRGLLCALFSTVSMDFFLEVGLGLGHTQHGQRPKEGEVGRKGISCEQTFRAMSARGELEEKCRELAASLAADMAAEGLKAKTITLKLKATTFEVRTRAVTLDRYASSAEDLAVAALRLLRAELPIELRLMGLRASNFYEQKREAGQLSLEDTLQRHKQHQQEQQHVEEEREPAAEAGTGGGVRQALSQGELVELSLRDWGEQPQEDGAGIQADRGGASLPAEAQAASAAHHPPPSDVEGEEGGHAAELLPGCDSARQQQPASVDGEHGERSAAASPVWACATCTFNNSWLHTRCEMCSTPRHKSHQQQPAAGRGRGRGRAGGTKRKSDQALAAPAATSRILLGFLTPKPQPSMQQQHQQSEGPGLADAQGPSSERGGGEELPPAAANTGDEREPHLGPCQAQHAQGSPADAMCSSADGMGPVSSGGSRGGSAAPGPGCAASPARSGGEGHADDGGSPWPGEEMVPFAGEDSEDLLECNRCRQWIREGKMQSHMDWHIAVDLQQKEDKHAALMGRLESHCGGSRGQGQPVAATARQQKRGGGGGQSTLTALLKKHSN